MMVIVAAYPMLSLVSYYIYVFHLILITTLGDRYYYFLSTVEETEV